MYRRMWRYEGTASRRQGRGKTGWPSFDGSTLDVTLDVSAQCVRYV